jgi:FKBP-type peptidyl-prolyl cis-trans isomerase FkpA
MKKYFLLFSIFIIGLSACNKDQLTEQAIVDDQKIQVYLKANNITGMTKDPSGYYYKILIPGTGPYPVSTSNVKVSYSGVFLDGQGFDSGTNSTFLLSGTVVGFQSAVERINPGGRIMFILPSALAYGVGGRGAIPANAILQFTLDMQSFY